MANDSPMQHALRNIRSAARRGGLLTGARLLARRCRNPLQLATIAEDAALIMPGGAYVRARLWARVEHLVAPEGFLNGARARLEAICDSTHVTPDDARRWSILGRTLESLDRSGNWDAGPLIHASRSVLITAARQRSKAERYLRLAARLLRRNPRTTEREIHQAWCRVNGSQKANMDVIKPSDWWAFSRPKWRRDADFPGSIPGEVYANALYYFAPRKGIVVDAMAGSGMLRRVYRQRGLWQKDSAFQLKLHLFDIDPRRSYIRRHDARRQLPVRADWIFVDPPYFGQSGHLYKGGLATTRTYRDYLEQLYRVMEAMARSLKAGGRLCLLLPKWSGKKLGHLNRDLPGDARRIGTEVGLTWVDCAYVSRGRQQERGFGFQNIAAKRARRLVSDTCVLNVFENRMRSR